MKGGLDFAAQSDPARNRQFSRRWTEVAHCGGFQPTSEATAEGAPNLKRQRQIEHVHQLGVRAVGELLRQVAAGENLDNALAPYQRLTPNLLKAVGGDRFPALPVYVVRQP